MPKSVIFVDSRVTDYQSLIDRLTEPAEVFVLDGASDGLTQIATYLQGRTGTDAIHVISHGTRNAHDWDSVDLFDAVGDVASAALAGFTLIGIEAPF